VGTFRIYVTADPEVLDGASTPFTMHVEKEASGETVDHRVNFNAPAR